MGEKLLTFFKKIKLQPIAIIGLSFLGVIFIGACFLALPIAHNEGTSVNFFDALFISTSCTCVTGLVSLPEGVAAAFNLFGRIVMGILIQLGGLGVTTIAVIIFMLTSRKLTFTKQSLIKESWNLNSYKGIKRIFAEVLAVSFSFELLGSILLFFVFYFGHHFSLDESIGYAVFHSVSAFNNAGFDLFGTTSLINFENDIALNLIISLLIIAGGLGFIVIIDIITKRFKFKKFRLHTKIVLVYTLFFIVFGTLAIYLSELFNESNTSFMGAFFMSVSTRTAGFTMYDLSKYRDVSLLIMIILMFVGASPGGTGGGVKTTTIALLFYYIRSIVTDRDPHTFRRNLNRGLIRKALLIILLGLLFFLIGLFIICFCEMDYNYIKDGIKYKDYIEGASTFNALDYAFEAMSAYGTVGLSTGFTAYFSTGSKIVLICLMYVGRLGPLTISTMFKSKNIQTYKYAEEEIAIG